MTTYSGIDIARIMAIREDIINLSRESKLSKELFKGLDESSQNEIKRIYANYNQLIKLSLELILETKEYSKTTYSWDSAENDEYEALMKIIGE